MSQSNSQPAQTIRTYDLVIHSEIVIDRPVAEVWPHFLVMNSWMASNRLEHFSGDAGKVGEIRRVFPSEGEAAADPYSIQTVKIDKHKQYVLKTYTDDRRTFLGYCDFSFTDRGTSTFMTYDIYVQFQVPDAPNMERIIEDQHREGQKSLDKNNQALKKLVESGKL